MSAFRNGLLAGAMLLAAAPLVAQQYPPETPPAPQGQPMGTPPATPTTTETTPAPSPEGDAANSEHKDGKKKEKQEGMAPKPDEPRG